MIKVKSEIEDIILNRLSNFYLTEGFVVKDVSITNDFSNRINVSITLYRISYCCPIVFNKVEEITRITLSSNIDNLGKVDIHYEGTYDRN